MISSNRPLTPREAAVLAGLMEGKTNKDIGHDLGVSEETIKVHVKAILRNLKVKTRTEAAVVAVRHKLSRAPRAIRE